MPDIADTYASYGLSAAVLLAVGFVVALKLPWPSVLDAVARRTHAIGLSAGALMALALVVYVSVALGRTPEEYACFDTADAGDALGGPYSPLAALGGVFLAGTLALFYAALALFVPDTDSSSARTIRRALGVATALAALGVAVMLPGALLWVNAAAGEIADCVAG